MYIMDVAHISHNAGTSKMKGLKILEPLVSELLSTEPSCEQINTGVQFNLFAENKNTVSLVALPQKLIKISSFKRRTRVFIDF